MKQNFSDSFKKYRSFIYILFCSVFLLAGCDTDQFKSDINGLDGTYQAIYYEKTDQTDNTIESVELSDGFENGNTVRYLRIEKNVFENISVTINDEPNTTVSEPVIFVVSKNRIIPFGAKEDNESEIFFELEDEGILTLTNICIKDGVATETETITYVRIEPIEIKGIVGRSEEFFPEVLPKRERDTSHIRKRIRFSAIN